MNWSAVGDWLKQNAGTGAALVGSLLTGNVPSAVAAGVSLVASATGRTDPQEVLEAFQRDPQTVVRLKELAIQNEVDIRQHIETMTRLELEDQQKRHEQTQLTIRAGDVAKDYLVRWTRPLQSWASLGFCFYYVDTTQTPDPFLVGLLLTLPFAYFGLREYGKSLLVQYGGIKKDKEAKYDEG